MKRRVVSTLMVGAMVLTTATAAGAVEGGWFEAIDALERSAEQASQQAAVMERQSAELDEHVMTTLNDADTAQRVIRELRRDVALDVVQWDAAMRRADRVQWSEGPRETKALHRAIETSGIPATEEWVDRVHLLAQVFEGIEHADALLVRSAELHVQRAQLLGGYRAAQAEREWIVELAANGDAREDIDRERQELAEALSRELSKIQAIPADEDFHRRKGALIPPVSAAIAHPFGPRQREDSFTEVRHTGVTYVIDVGTSVRSVAAGKVAEAGRLPGYGKFIIVDHGDEYHTIYAHLDSFDVEVGDEIDARQVIGASGQSGSLEGPKLYFELRRQGRPVDPEEWFVTR